MPMGEPCGPCSGMADERRVCGAVNYSVFWNPGPVCSLSCSKFPEKSGVVFDTIILDP